MAMIMAMTTTADVPAEPARSDRLTKTKNDPGFWPGFFFAAIIKKAANLAE
jgi:hypothetical protein